MGSRESKPFKDWFPWVALVSATTSLLLVVYLKVVFIFETNLVPSRLELLAIGASVVAVLFAVMTFPRWQSLVALSTAVFVMYMIFFTPMYAFSGS